MVNVVVVYGLIYVQKMGWHMNESSNIFFAVGKFLVPFKADMICWSYALCYTKMRKNLGHLVGKK